MIYDCFSFFNELDLLEIRLNVLKDVVDKFVLVEATRTHTGRPKPLYYEENKARYAAFADRIIHVVVDDFSAAEGLPTVREKAWAVENIQRNAIARGLIGAKPNDIIIISDLDEIPKPEAVRQAVGLPGVTRLGMKIYNYFLNLHDYSTSQWMLATQVLSYGTFCNPLTYRGFEFGEFVIRSVNTCPSATMIRFLKSHRTFRNAGWHFSYLGGVEAIRNKVRSIAHTEFDTERTVTDEWIKARIAAGEDLFCRGDRCFADAIDETFPRYLRDNADRYARLIYPVDAAYLRKMRLAKFLYGLRGRIRGCVVKCVPSVLVPVLMRLRDRVHGV